jgi:hypothetical protein
MKPNLRLAVIIPALALQPLSAHAVTYINETFEDNTTLGRLDFSSTTTALADFSIDNLLVTDVAAIPEPSSAALLLGGGLSVAVFSRRRYFH